MRSSFSIVAKFTLRIMKGSVIMLFTTILLSAIYACIHLLEKLGKENETRKASEEGYEVYFSY